MSNRAVGHSEVMVRVSEATVNHDNRYERNIHPDQSVVSLCLPH